MENPASLQRLPSEQHAYFIEEHKKLHPPSGWLHEHRVRAFFLELHASPLKESAEERARRYMTPAPFLMLFTSPIMFLVLVWFVWLVWFSEHLLPVVIITLLFFLILLCVSAHWDMKKVYPPMNRQTMLESRIIYYLLSYHVFQEFEASHHWDEIGKKAWTTACWTVADTDRWYERADEEMLEHLRQALSTYRVRIEGSGPYRDDVVPLVSLYNSLEELEGLVKKRRAHLLPREGAPLQIDLPNGDDLTTVMRGHWRKATEAIQLLEHRARQEVASYFTEGAVSQDEASTLQNATRPTASRR